MNTWNMKSWKHNMLNTTFHTKLNVARRRKRGRRTGRQEGVWDQSAASKPVHPNSSGTRLTRQRQASGGSLETSRTDGHHQPQTIPSDKMHTSNTWCNRTKRSIYMHVTESVCNHCSRFEIINCLHNSVKDGKLFPWISNIEGWETIPPGYE